MGAKKALHTLWDSYRQRTDKIFKRTLEKHWGRWAEALPKLPPCPARAAVEVLALGGDFREAFAALPYFIQQINVEAYQSYLWNAIASELLGRVCPAGALWEAEDPLGLMRFAAATAIPAALARLDMPLLGPLDAVRAALGRRGGSGAQSPRPGGRGPAHSGAAQALLRRGAAEVAGGDGGVRHVRPKPGAICPRAHRLLQDAVLRAARLCVRHGPAGGPGVTSGSRV